MTTSTERAPLKAHLSTSLMHRLTIAFGPIGRPLAGTRWFPLWAILRHTGRKSGTPYAIPIVALPTADGFVIPLPFGDGTQWLQNVLAAGGGGIRRRAYEYVVDQPVVADIDDPAIAGALPRPLRAVSKRLGITRWVRVRRRD
jgi:deazaflavin-dependent oxidoreductase (nitroreductase family)